MGRPRRGLKVMSFCLYPKGNEKSCIIEWGWGARLGSPDQICVWTMSGLSVERSNKADSERRGHLQLLQQSTWGIR